VNFLRPLVGKRVARLTASVAVSHDDRYLTAPTTSKSVVEFVVRTGSVQIAVVI